MNKKKLTCGCENNEEHAMATSKDSNEREFYLIWLNMLKQAGINKKTTHVIPPKKIGEAETILERIDENKPWCKENCRFVTNIKSS